LKGSWRPENSKKLGVALRGGIPRWRTVHPKPVTTGLYIKLKKGSHCTLVSPPAGEMLPINVHPFDINEDVPSNLEIRGVVRELRNR
jgi:hypothetical protein